MCRFGAWNRHERAVIKTTGLGGPTLLTVGEGSGSFAGIGAGGR